MLSIGEKLNDTPRKTEAAIAAAISARDVALVHDVVLGQAAAGEDALPWRRRRLS